MTRSPTPLVVLDVAGLTPRLLAYMPQLAAITEAGGWRAELGTVLPAVTCSAQATLLTGTLPREHGIVGNGWYFRGLGEVLLWRQHNALDGWGQAVGCRAAGASRVHRGQRLLVVCDGRAGGLDGDPTPGVPRRRPQGPGLLHRPTRPARRAHHRARHVPAVQLLGPGRRDRIVHAGSAGPRSTSWSATTRI